MAKSRKKTSAEYSKAWRTAHPGYMAAATRKYRETHPEIYLETIEQWKKRNPNYKKNWRAAHPGYDVIASMKCRNAAPEKYRRKAVVSTAKWRKNNPDYKAPLSSTGYHRTAREKAAGRKKPKRCDICKKTGRRICFDHCHKSKKFRGWICLQCNAALGHVGDSVKTLVRMIEYLSRNQPKNKLPQIRI